MKTVFLYVYITLYLIVDYILLIVAGFRLGRDEGSNNCENSGCTVIIPLVDDIKGLIRTIRSLSRQDYKIIEIIVVANGLRSYFIRKKIEDKLDNVFEDLDIRLLSVRREKHIPCRVEYEMEATINTKGPLSLRKLFRQRDRWQRGLIGSFLGNITFRRDKRFTMRYIAQPYILFFEIMAPVVFGVGVVRFIYLIMLGEFNRENFVFSLVYLTVYALIESLTDVAVEIRRCKVDHERFMTIYIIYAVVMQVPMVGLQSFLMVAKLYGTLTYPFRKRVW